MLRIVLTLLGVLSITVGVLGFMRPHNVIPLSCGVLAIYFGTEASLPAARAFSRVLGACYLLLGALGYALGEPGTFWLDGPRSDPRAFKPFPGLLEFGTPDHNVHLLMGIAGLSAGMFAKIREPRRAIAPERSALP